MTKGDAQTDCKCQITFKTIYQMYKYTTIQIVLSKCKLNQSLVTILIKNNEYKY